MAGGGYDLEEIRRRADIVELISPHVALRRRAGGRQLTGLCPFHQERTPSFSVDAEKGVWHCFGCKAGGDIFDFVEMIEKVSFGEAVEMLGRRYGVEPRAPDGGVRQRQKERLFALYEQAAEFFQNWLKTNMAHAARNYLASRGVSMSVAQEFRLGYAPSAWDSLLSALLKRGFTEEEISTSGLTVAREGKHYDRFRDRIIFPIWDTSGRVIAFGGRAMQDDQPPKYLNSPETMLFSKGRVLYAFDRARRAMDEKGRAILVEGYLDAIACHEAGFVETVATMGTALTPDHVAMLRRRVAQIVLAFDADSAGLSAALRSRELFQQAELAVRVVTLPEKVDPDQLIRMGGTAAFTAVAEAALPIVEWELSRILAQAAGLPENARMEKFREAVVALTRVPPGVEREYYIGWLAQQWAPGDATHAASMERAVRAEIGRLGTRRSGGGQRMETGASERPVPERTPAKPAVGQRVETELLAALLHYGKFASRYLGILEASDFTEEAHRHIFAAMAEAVTTLGDKLEAPVILTRLEESAHGAFSALVMQEIPPERIQERIERDVNRLLERRILRRREALLRRLEEVGSGSEQEALQAELNECTSQLNKLKAQRTIG